MMNTNKIKLSNTLLSLACTSLLPGIVSADTLFVNTNLNSGTNDGSSWSNAFNGPLALQDALQIADNGDQIHIASGTYLPDLPDGDRLSTFLITRAIHLKGGYSGDPKNPDQRDPQLFETILSGDLNQNDDNTNRGGPGSLFTDNAHNVVVVHIGSGVEFESITIAHGRADISGNSDQSSGSNMLILTGDPIIRDCIIRDGYASHAGGGIAITHSQPIFEDCTFINNRAQNFGGGVAVLDESDSLFTDCTFDANIGGFGCGLYVGGTNIFDTESNAKIEIRDSEFINNIGLVGAAQGGGIQVNKSEALVINTEFHNNEVPSGGGAINTNAKSAEFIGCKFSGNNAIADGGSVIYDDGQGVHVGAFDSNPVRFTNCVMYNNNGVAVSVFDGSIIFTNCTIANNTLEPKFPVWPTMLFSRESSLEINNSILWNNDPQDLAQTNHQEIVHHNPQGETNITVTNSYIEIWDGRFPGTALNIDPRFIDIDGPDDILGNEDDDLRLSFGSPAIDFGINDHILQDIADLDNDGDINELTPLDINLQNRFIDDVLTVNSGTGTGPLADLGAYEYAPACRADLNGDELFNFFDISFFLELFRSGDPRADLHTDGRLDFFDISIFLDLVSKGC